MSAPPLAGMKSANMPTNRNREKAVPECRSYFETALPFGHDVGHRCTLDPGHTGRHRCAFCPLLMLVAWAFGGEAVGASATARPRATPGPTLPKSAGAVERGFDEAMKAMGRRARRRGRDVPSSQPAS